MQVLIKLNDTENKVFINLVGMTDVRINQVYNNYENLKRFLLVNIDILPLEKLKTRFKISRRRHDFITNVSSLIATLEKFGELDAFTLEPMKIVYGTISESTELYDVKIQLGNLIKMHEVLIRRCGNVVLPVHNQYAEEILKRRSENYRNNLRRSGRNENDFRNHSERNISSEIPYMDEENNFNASNTEENNICDKYSQVIDLISSEIGLYWKDFARNLGMKDSEIDEIYHDTNYRYLRDKSRRSLNVMLPILHRKNPCTLTTELREALKKTRRNDIRKRVETMI